MINFMNKKMNQYLYMIINRIKMINMKNRNHYRWMKREKMNQMKINNKFKMMRKAKRYKMMKKLLKVNNPTKILKITQIKKTNQDFSTKKEKKLRRMNKVSNQYVINSQI